MSQKVNKKNCYILIIILTISFSSNILFGQEFTGTVKDTEDNSSIAFVNVFFKNTTIGVISDIDGNYSIRKKRVTKKDSLVFSYLGYATKIIAVKDLKNNAVIYLKPESSQLNAVVIRGKADPYTDRLMRKIIRNKKKNDPANVRKVQYNETALLSVYLANLQKEVLNKRRFKNFKDSFLKDSDSTVMMPILLSKEGFKHRIDKDENIDITKNIYEEQEGTLEQLNGLIKTTINQKITQNINFYDENIDLLGRSFQSPITSDYKSYYHLYLADSSMVDGVKQYQFQYYPKNEKSVAFDGEFWVDSESFALTKIEAAIPVEANVNFIKSLEVEINYQKPDSVHWVIKSQKTNTTMSFTGSKKKKSKHFLVQKNQKYSDYNFDFKSSKKLVDSLEAMIPYNSALSKLGDETVLDSLEANAIKGIRSLKKNNSIKFLDRFATMTLTGYYNLNKFDFGPYFDLYIKNGIEGSRFSLPFRTSQKMSDKYTIGGYVGYGLKDKGFKYGINAKYLLPTEKRTVIGINHFDDFRTIAQSRYIEFVQENPYSRGGGNVLSVFSDKNRLNFNMLKQKHIDVSLTYQANENASYLIRPFYDTFEENEFNRLIHNSSNVKGFRSQGVLFDLRYSKARNFDQQFFSRIYYGSIKPVYHFTAEIGHNKITGSASKFSAYYARLNASMKKKFLVGSGFVKMFLDTGYIIGKVPYPILNNPSGNQNIGLARFNYNLLNPTSFSSDVFANLHTSFNGGGFLFNKLPLLSSLNIRESLSFKAFYGKLRDGHDEFFKLPVGLIELPKEPYMEVGIGISNIMKVLRIEYVRRINSSPIFDEISVKGGVKLRIEVSF
ncbi:DUF5686 and carboxypeptidase-like regulatory domain-containing protein [uncultured Algibacter sp.]|uniref:DUF5686 and carboxypeptidase-like regulatory domain-containing protein n=1 Tax=uncultured Algibacter sp. TaxID=298659 RepID=UPI002633F6E2|nr:DUF5686 and carboxypeptidase-like regulatory domain-containing protein [uncultured Algibacter sp.]